MSVVSASTITATGDYPVQRVAQHRQERTVDLHLGANRVLQYFQRVGNGDLVISDSKEDVVAREDLAGSPVLETGLALVEGSSS